MSAEYVDTVVDARRRNPRPGERILVAVGAAGELEQLADEIGALDSEAEVRKRLPYDTLRVMVPETALDDLCSLSGVETVETEGRLRPHESGN